MLIWGGVGTVSLNNGKRYKPSNDTWTALPSAGAPFARQGHTAVWTGTELLIWGGTNGNALNDGGQFNPVANTWTSTASLGAPASRFGHTAVWTGSEMIIWGGSNDDGYPQQGGRYNPVTNHWSPTTTIGAPLVRDKYTAVWTGTEMIVWGGSQAQGPGNTPYNDGKRYNPATDSWFPVSLTGAPSARKSHTAIWTGTEMIVWGGWDGTQYSNNGGRYNPSTNSWLAIPSAAVSGRYDHTAIWTGTSMVIWGGSGSGGLLGDGWSYEPGGLNYVLQTGQAPSARTAHRAIWTGTEMIIWAGLDASSAGGQACDGSRWNGRSGQWKRLPTFNAPTSLAKPNVFWTGTEMLISDTYTTTSENIHAPGALFNPATETWSPMTSKLPPPRYLTPAVWTGHSMLIFSGVSPYNYRFPNISGNPYHSDVWEYTPGKTFFLYQKL